MSIHSESRSSRKSPADGDATRAARSGDSSQRINVRESDGDPANYRESIETTGAYRIIWPYWLAAAVLSAAIWLGLAWLVGLV